MMSELRALSVGQLLVNAKGTASANVVGQEAGEASMHPECGSLPAATLKFESEIDEEVRVD